MGAKRQNVKNEILPIREGKSGSHEDQLPDFPRVNTRQLAILTYLAQSWPAVKPQVETAEAVGYETRQAVKRHLDPLVSVGLAAYDSRLRGHYATELGRQLVEFVEHQNDTQTTPS